MFFVPLSWHCKHVSGQILSILPHCTRVLTAGCCSNDCIVFRVLTELQRMCLRWSTQESITHCVKVWLGSFNVVYMQKSLQTYRQKMLSSAFLSSKVWCLFRWRGQFFVMFIHSSGEPRPAVTMERRSGSRFRGKYTNRTTPRPLCQFTTEMMQQKVSQLTHPSKTL